MFYSLQYQTILPLFHNKCKLCIYQFIFKNPTNILKYQKKRVVILKIRKIFSELVVNFRSKIREFGYSIVSIYKSKKFAIGKMIKTMPQ